MPTTATRLGLFIVLSLALGLAGCAAAPPASTALGSAAPTTAVASQALPAPSDDGATTATPPTARLSVDGGDPVPGQIGTYIWADGGSDSPWLPGAPITAGTGEILSVTLPPDVAMSSWSALLAPAANTGGEDATLVGSGPAAMDLVAPRAGSWTLAVTIGFGGLGRATYFWRLDVV